MAQVTAEQQVLFNKTVLEFQSEIRFWITMIAIFQMNPQHNFPCQAFRCYSGIGQNPDSRNTSYLFFNYIQHLGENRCIFISNKAISENIYNAEWKLCKGIFVSISVQELSFQYLIYVVVQLNNWRCLMVRIYQNLQQDILHYSKCFC